MRRKCCEKAYPKWPQRNVCRGTRARWVRGRRRSERVACDWPVDRARRRSDRQRRESGIEDRTGQCVASGSLVGKAQRCRINGPLPRGARVELEIRGEWLLAVAREHLLCARDVEGVVQGSAVYSNGSVGAGF